MSDNPLILVDTSVLVYAYDRSEPEKQAKAIMVLERLIADGVGALSAQVLAEFFVTVTRKLSAPLTVERALESLENYLASWIIFDTTSLVVFEAGRGVRDHKFSYFDAQIWSVARLNQIPIVLSEDFNPSMIEGVQFVNPFSQEFSLEEWLAGG
jgi:predicted nucleic acid-binding protein